MPASRRYFLKGLAAATLLPALPAVANIVHPSDARSALHRVLSCNIRVALEEDEAKGVGWTARRDICLKIIAKKKPDIIALQEVLKVQADDFRKHFSSFRLIGFDGPEMDIHESGYHGIAKNPVLFSKDRYELVAAGNYWLSETPLIAGSKSWGTARARNANWVRLKDKRTSRHLRLINVHLDHVSDQARIAQAKMVIEESAQYSPDFIQILTGDFNARYDSAVFTSVRSAGWKESYETIHGSREAGYTGHEFQGLNYAKGATKGRIDYIWYKGDIKPASAHIIKDSANGKYPSDHFFVQADFAIEQKH